MAEGVHDLWVIIMEEREERGKREEGVSFPHALRPYHSARVSLPFFVLKRTGVQFPGQSVPCYKPPGRPVRRQTLHRGLDFQPEDNLAIWVVLFGQP